MAEALQIPPYVLRGDAAAARFCGFASRDKFQAWARAQKLVPPVRRAGARNVYRIADLQKALDAEVSAGLPAKSKPTTS